MLKYSYILILLNYLLISSLNAYSLDEVLVKELSKHKTVAKNLQVFRALELSYSKEKNMNSSFDETLKDDYKAVIRVTQHIFDELEMTNETSRQEARVLEAARNYLESIHSLIFKVTMLYIKVLHSIEKVDIAQEMLQGHKDIFSEVKFSYELGLITSAEKDSFESSLALAYSNLEKEKMQETKSRREYHNTLGYFPNIERGSRPDFNTKLPLEKDEVIFLILEYNPSLFQYRYNINKKSSIRDEFIQSQDSSLHRISFTDLEDGNLLNQVTQRIESLWSANKRLKEKLLNLVWYSHYYAASLAHVKAEQNTGKILFVEVLLAKNDILKSRKNIMDTEYEILFTQLGLLDVMGSLVPKINQSNQVAPEVLKDIQEKVILYINFKYSSSTLPENVKRELVKLSDYLFRNPNAKANITGHTSRTKNSKEKSNIRLSLQRANIIRDELVNVYGINPQRLFTYGKGHNEPIADNETSEGRVKNRRIEIDLFE